MRYEAYRDLIQRLEIEAAHDPEGYTLRVGAFGVLGYAYILGVFGALLAVLWFFPRLSPGPGSLLSIKLGLLLIPIGIVILKPLFGSFPAPRGVRLVRDRVPALFAMIDEVAATLKSPLPDRVILTPDYNCSMLQRPRLGIFGWPENTLMLGLPMLETLSRARFRAILAHELGHLVAHHSTFAGRLHAVSHVWRQLLDRLSNRPNVLYRALEAFFRWYGPRFQAMGFVLGRRQEYFADACSRRVAGVRATRGALVRIEVMSRHYREVMERSVHARIRNTTEPPEDLLPSIARRMREDPETDRARKWIEESCRAETGYEHTHPALRDRLQALESGTAPGLNDALAEPGATAAEDLLGNHLDPLTREVSARWIADVANWWGQRHELLGALECDTDSIDANRPELSDSSDAAWGALTARIELDGAQTAPERLAAFLETHPQHAPARYRLGHALLQCGDAAGLDQLEQAMQLDSDATPPACGIAIDFLRAQGRGREAEDFTRRAWEFSELVHQADQERRFLRKRDTLVPHELSDEVVSELRRRLAQENWITSAHLVRKRTSLRSDKPCHVLGVRLNRAWYKYADRSRDDERARVFLREAVPSGTWMFYLEGDLRWARKRLAGIDRALIWERARSEARGEERAKAA